MPQGKKEKAKQVKQSKAWEKESKANKEDRESKINKEKERLKEKSTGETFEARGKTELHKIGETLLNLKGLASYSQALFISAMKEQ